MFIFTGLVGLKKCKFKIVLLIILHFVKKVLDFIFTTLYNKYCSRDTVPAGETATQIKQATD